MESKRHKILNREWSVDTCEFVFVIFTYNMFPGFKIWINIPATAFQETLSLSRNPNAQDLIQKSRPLIHSQPQMNPTHFFFVVCLGPVLILYPIYTYICQAMWYNIFAKKNFCNTEWNNEIFCTAIQPGLNNACEKFWLEKSMFCWPCTIVYQYSKTNVMHILFSLLRIKGLYMFRAVLAQLQEVLYQRYLVYVGIACVLCARVGVPLQSWCSQLT
jgi:hypothetical protein